MPVTFEHERYNLSVPFTSSMHGLQDGQRVRIVGLPNADASHFTVNLRRGDNINFHFNPRFNQGCVVMNNREYGEWQAEEYINSVPFTPGKLFTLDLVCCCGSIEIHVDGHAVGKFAIRGDLNNVDGVEVEGDVHVHSLHYNI
ncbi:Galectin-5 [Toxocara canis]|uniref:Galectin n=1 Tax=Toxocara canis TaxID=6265 RepID=A0A0B2W2G3_TOXCA|nr:Galectin-5 [Toxocara canis]